MTDITLAQRIERFDSYFRSANGMPANTRISVPTSEWLELHAALTATPAAPAAPEADAPHQAVLDSRWRERMLDGRALVRDEMGFGEHPELPMLDEGMKPRAFFAALGVELKHTMAEDDLELTEHEAMNDAGNWSAWIPRPPAGADWKLVAIFDTEDGQAAWWVREAIAASASKGGEA